MRKLKLQMQQTVNGFVGGPNGELDWMEWSWDEALKNDVIKLTATIDTILMGRKMSDGFCSHWENAVTTPETPEFEFAKIMVDTPKVIFSKTLEKSDWKNTVIAKGDIVEEVNKLKNKNGKDIIVYGGANFVSSLIKHELIDELYLFINPTAIGNGLEIFASRTNLKLTNTKAYECGIVVLQYKFKNE